METSNSVELGLMFPFQLCACVLILCKEQQRELFRLSKHFKGT